MAVIKSQLFGFPVNMDEADITYAKVQQGGNLVDLIDLIGDPQTNALAGLTPTADSVPYFTSETTAAVTTLTTFARSILDDANEAAFKATVNLEIGTDVQAWDAQLDSLSSASANGVSLVTAANYAAMKALLDLEIGIDVQAYSANLASWSALATSAKADTSHVHSAADITSGTLDAARLPTSSSGSVLQVVETRNTSDYTTSTTIAADDTAPQNTEGAEAFTLSITPKEATSKILVEIDGWFSGSTTSSAMFALFKDSDASAFAATLINPASAGFSTPVTLRGSFTSGGTSAITVKFRFGGSGANTVYLNRLSGGTYLSTTDGITMKLTEIKA